MEDSQHHHSCLDDAEALKKVNAVSHGEGGRKVYDENHRMENLQVGLKHFVLEFPPKMRC